MVNDPLPESEVETKFWLGVASAEHVRRGVNLGIAQIGHGRRSGLAQMNPGDILFYYSPTEQLRDRIPLQRFTALGQVEHAPIWQAQESTFMPYRRKVNYQQTRSVPLEQVRDRLHLCSDPHWGYRLRRGLVCIDAHDAAVLKYEMLTTHG